MYPWTGIVLKLWNLFSFWTKCVKLIWKEPEWKNEKWILFALNPFWVITHRYTPFLSDYTKIHSRRPNFFAAAIIFIKWNLKERKRGNCRVWNNWFKIWQVFGLWIFISQFSSNIIEIYVIWEFKESLYRYTYLVKICPIFGTDYAQTDLEGSLCQRGLQRDLPVTYNEHSLKIVFFMEW